jgi:hypothetical protein
MWEEKTYSVTLVRVGPGLPFFERGAYRYTGSWLPLVGDLITVTREAGDDGDEREELLGYVTWVNAASDTPIRVTQAKGVAARSADDYIVAA